MAADLKIVVTGYDAALAKLTALSKGYDDLAKKAVETQKKASKARLSIIADEVQQARSLYKSVKPTSGAGRSSGGGSKGGGSSDGGVSSAIAGGIAGGVAMGAVGLAAGALKGALDAAVDGLKSFGSFLLNDVFKPQMRLEKAAVQLENASGGQITASVVMSKANAAQLKWNIEANDAAAVMADLMDQTGRIDLAFDRFDDLAKLSKAYNGEVKEYASVVAAIASYDPKASADTILGMVKQISAAGQEKGGKFTGSVQARAGGAQFGALPFIAGANLSEKVATSNALMQFAGMQGKYEETITAQSALVSDAIRLSKQGVLQGPGMVTKAGTLDVEKMIEAVMRKTVVTDHKGVASSKADILKTIGMSEPAQRMAGQAQMKFADLLIANGGKVDEAIKDLLKSFQAFKNAKIDEKKLNADASRTMQTTAEKWDSAMNAIKGQLVELYPKFQRLVETLATGAPALAKILESLADALLSAALWIAKKAGDASAVRSVQQAAEVREVSRQIEVAEAAGNKPEVDRLKVRRKEILASQESENALVDQLAAGYGGKSQEERKESREKAIRKAEEFNQDWEKLAPNDKLLTAKTQEDMKKHLGGTESEQNAYSAFLMREKNRHISNAAEQAAGEPTGSKTSGLATAMDSLSLREQRDALTKELAGLTDDLEGYAGRVRGAGDKIPTGPMGGGANGGTK